MKDNLKMFDKQAPRPPLPTNQINVNAAEQLPESCSCGCVVFRPAVLFYRISAVMSPTGQEQLLPMQIFTCSNCDSIYGPIGEAVEKVLKANTKEEVLGPSQPPIPPGHHPVG